MQWGGNDYSADCERTDLGELLYCGLFRDLPDVDDETKNRLFDAFDAFGKGSTITAIVNGSECGVGKFSDDTLVIDGGYEIRLEEDTETGRRSIYIGYPETEGNAHIALYVRYAH